MGHRKKNRQEHTQNAFIYIIQCCDDNEYVKIGLTTDSAVTRQASLQVGCPYELKVVASFNVSGELHKIEQTLHKQLERFRLRGEWFKLNAAQALQFITASLPLLDVSFAVTPKEDKPETQAITGKESIKDTPTLTKEVAIEQVKKYMQKGLSLSGLAKKISCNKGLLHNILNEKKSMPESVQKSLSVFFSTGTAASPANKNLHTTANRRRV